MDNNFFGENIKRLRREAGMSQEELAEKIGVTSQAVSKWECALSLPDISLILPLADLLGVSTDELLRGEKSECSGEGEVRHTPTIPDDGKLRVFQFLGTKLLSVDEANGREPIRLVLPDTDEGSISVEVTGNVVIDGPVYGNVSANGDVSVGDGVSGNITAGCDVTVSDGVSGNVSAGCDVAVKDDVGGNVYAGGDVIVNDNVHGSVTAGGDVVTNR